MADVMDTFPVQKRLHKLTPLRRNNKLFSPRRRDDFSNDSRSDDDDEESGEVPGFQHSTSRSDLDEDLAEEKASECMGTCSFNETRGQELSDDCIEDTDQGLDEDSSCVYLYKDPSLMSYRDLTLDIENNASLWVAPPPDGVSDPDNNVEEDATFPSAWESPNSLGSLINTKLRSKHSLPFEQCGDMRAVVTGHFRVIVAQLLSREGVSADDSRGPESWIDLVTSLSLQAASIIKPDTSQYGGMDPGGYVKVKYVANGRPSESRVVRGIVCKKNVAHKRMRSRFDDPKVLLLGCSLEFEMVTSQLPSLKALLQQVAFVTMYFLTNPKE